MGLPTEMPLAPRDHAITLRASPKVPAPGPPRVDSQLMTAPTELPSADLLPSKLPTEMPLAPRDHAITLLASPKVPAPGPPRVDSQLMTAPTELPSADLLLS